MGESAIIAIQLYNYRYLLWLFCLAGMLGNSKKHPVLSFHNTVTVILEVPCFESTKYAGGNISFTALA
jgi:hypothetical protein